MRAATGGWGLTYTFLASGLFVWSLNRQRTRDCSDDGAWMLSVFSDLRTICRSDVYQLEVTQQLRGIPKPCTYSGITIAVRVCLLFLRESIAHTYKVFSLLGLRKPIACWQVKGTHEWLKGWKENQWNTNAGKTVKNQVCI